jgi:hypothetical protein
LREWSWFSSSTLTFATCVILSGCFSTLSAEAQSLERTDALREGFADPPREARPRVWWHWVGGNITREGIRKDIEWMARIGLGGMQNFDALLPTPPIVANRLAYMAPEWKDAFGYAAQLADQLDLELAIATSPGWSETGGPWVQPKDAMKKLVWSETELAGGEHFKGRLAAPPRTTGPFQSLPMGMSVGELLGGEARKSPEYYADVAVLAYRLPDDSAPASFKLKTARGAELDASAVADESYETGVDVSKGTAEEPGYLLVEYQQTQTIRAATLFTSIPITLLSPPNVLPRLEASDNGTSWRSVIDIPLTGVPTTVSFAPVSGRYFRVLVTANPARAQPLFSPVPGAVPFTFRVPPASSSLKFLTLKLESISRVHRAEAKAGYTIAPNYYALESNADVNEKGVASDDIVDLTERMSTDGVLDWSPPRAGRWRVLRFGYSLIGVTNHPATPEATGLEVDKYDGAAVRNYMDTYLGMYRDIVGGAKMGRRGLRALVSDSIEVGPSNWTPNFRAQFQRLRGYDPRPWMPTIAGVLVGSRAQSDAFLYDFRRTLADLVATEHYGEVAAAAHANGMKVYGEALEGERFSLGDDMSMRRHADVPMAALWTYRPSDGPHARSLADMKGASSTAHIYGRSAVAAESLTSALAPWAHAPVDLKAAIDLEFANGINLPVIHTSVHQPVDDKVPGLPLIIFGQYFTRHETWAEMARPWIDYIARSSFMLQQGRDVADIAYFYGEEAPLIALYQEQRVADIPTGYAYDFVSADALLHELHADGSDAVTKGGARYRIIYLGGSSQRMTVPVLQRLAELARAGVTIVGKAPENTPSLKDDSAIFKSLVDRLWSGATTTPVGKGRVIATTDAGAALRSIEAAPDVRFTKRAADMEVLFVHRTSADGEIYYLNNRNDRAESFDAHFRVTGKKPELWRADLGTSEPLSYRVEGDTTVVPLKMRPQDAYFVVFRTPADSASQTVPELQWEALAQVGGPWDVGFQSGRGAPASVQLPTLTSLSDSPDPRVRYFSGVATYRKTFHLPRSIRAGARVLLDLGNVGDIAEVIVNGRSVGYAWKPPYRVDISRALHAGQNGLEIRVANLWVNRLIGDAQPNATKIAYTALPTYSAEAPLRSSGLLGPVQLLVAKQVAATGARTQPQRLPRASH